MQEIFNKVYNGLKSQSFMRSLTELMAAHDEAQDGYDMERLLRIIADKHGLKVPS